MSNLTQSRDARQKSRINENIPVQWWVQDQDFIAQGRIRNLSASGFLLETDKVFRPHDHSTLQIQSLAPHSSDFLPETGHIRWHRQKGPRSQYGIAFNQIEPKTASILEKRIEKIMSQSTQKGKWANIIGVMLTVIMIALTCYVLYLQNQNYKTVTYSNDHLLVSSVQQADNYQSYVHQYKVTKVQLEATTAKLEQVQLALDQVTTELNSTKDLLTQTQTQLTEAQSENSRLSDQLAALGVTEGTQQSQQITSELSNLKSKNEQYSQEINDLKGKLKAINVDASNMQEAKTLLELFRSKVDLVKARIRELNQQAYMTKVNAQKERDRIETLAGNGGFAIKDGEITLTNKKQPAFAVDVKILQ